MSDEGTLEPFPLDGRWAPNVIDFAGLQLQHGKRKHRLPAKCEHKRLLYSTAERSVECQDCGKEVEHFQAFMILVSHFDKMMDQAKIHLARAKAGSEAHLVRRASKEIDRSWGHKMAPCCPHCRNGLLPEDFERGAAAAISRELEIARRKRKGAETDR